MSNCSSDRYLLYERKKEKISVGCRDLGAKMPLTPTRTNKFSFLAFGNPLLDIVTPVTSGEESRLVDKFGLRKDVGQEMDTAGLLEEVMDKKGSVVHVHVVHVGRWRGEGMQTTILTYRFLSFNMFCSWGQLQLCFWNLILSNEDKNEGTMPFLPP